MNKPANTPADKPKTTRRARLVATSLGVCALLAIGGVAWASGLSYSAGSSAAPGARPGTTVGTPAAGSPDPAAASGAPAAGAPAAASGAPATAPTPSGPPEVNPAPVNRSGKSDQELADIAQPTAAPVELTAKKAVKVGVSATITDMTAVQGVATGIGEVAGPAVRFKVTVVNGTAAPISLDRALVDLSYGKEDSPAGQLSGPDPVAFPASVAPGATGAGVFIFAVPLDARDTVKIHFNLEAETPIATFAGRAPSGNAP